MTPHLVRSLVGIWLLASVAVACSSPEDSTPTTYPPRACDVALTAVTSKEFRLGGFPPFEGPAFEAAPWDPTVYWVFAGWQLFHETTSSATKPLIRYDLSGVVKPGSEFDFTTYEWFQPISKGKDRARREVVIGTTGWVDEMVTPRFAPCEVRDGAIVANPMRIDIQTMPPSGNNGVPEGIAPSGTAPGWPEPVEYPAAITGGMRFPVATSEPATKDGEPMTRYSIAPHPEQPWVAITIVADARNQIRQVDVVNTHTDTPIAHLDARPDPDHPPLRDPTDQPRITLPPRPPYAPT